MKLSENNNWDAGMKIAASVALFFIGKKFIADSKKSGAEADMDTNAASGQAASIKQALNPSGFSWLKNVDGTDKESIMRIAPQISNLDDVASHYKGLTDGSSLYDDLQSAFSPDEYQKFLSLATKGKTGSYFYAKKSEQVPSNQWVITTKEANIRTSPVYQWQRAFVNNIVKLAPAGMKLGASTGKYAYDELAKVLFVEFWTFTSKGEKKTYFVAKSQIEFVTQDELKKREKQGKIPLQVMEGIKDFGNVEDTEDLKNIADDPQQEVSTKETAMVYDEQLKPIGLVAKQTIMGTLLMTLNTGKVSYVKFRTIQGKLRWIREDMAVITEKKV